MLKIFIPFSLLVLLAACGQGEKRDFEDSLTYSLKANQISARFPEMQNSLSKEGLKRDEEKLHQYLEMSLKSGEAVSDKFLAELHPELADHYRNFLMGGQKLYLEGLREGNSVKQIKGIRLLQLWGEFWHTHAESIMKKLKSL